MTQTREEEDRPRALLIIYLVSAALVGAVLFLIYGPRPEGLVGQIDVSALPTVNASLNALTTLLLVLGFALVKAKRLVAHRRVMLGAFATSTAFLLCYVVYHWFKAGPKPYVGDFRGLYLGVLLTHIVLAAIILPLALLTLYRGWTNSLEKHRRLARVTLPLWLYVSVTGVVIYGMLYL